MRRWASFGLVLLLFLSSRFCFGQQAAAESLASLLSRFQSERTIEAKEAIINLIAKDHPEAGRPLLQVARDTDDADTKWLAIRGLGYLKYSPAAPFLIDCLSNQHHYVRANAARALGDLKAYSAKPELITLLKTEQDNGVIEQTTAALEMLDASEARPVLRARASNVSNSQTQCWLIGGLAIFGDRKDVPFVAERIYSNDQTVALCASTSLQQITKQDLHLGFHTGLISPTAIIGRARSWWEQNGSEWK